MIESAHARDLPAVHTLLEQVHLPLAGVDDHVDTMLVAREGGVIVGTAAVELYAGSALLRSVAVDPRWQGRQLGHQLTEAALRLAVTHGADAVFLLTTTAERFFPKFGFEAIARDLVPAAVRASVEFQSACPASAIAMRKLLSGGTTETSMERVIFACVHNAGRSQMAAAFFHALADPRKAVATSAGTQPGDRLHPEVVDVMREVGIDLSGQRPQRLTDDLARSATLLVTMGCGDECPYVPQLPRDDWPLQDPRGQELARVREIRDEIRARVEALVTANAWGRM